MTEQVNQVSQIIDLIQKWKSRLSWDDYFMSLAFLSSSRSACERLHVGCVIVKDNRIISTGYNGFLPGAPHNSIIEDNHEQATVHAEHNCISDSAKRGVSVDGAVAYVTHFPCTNCFKLLSASGITHIKYKYDYKNEATVYKLAEDTHILLEKFE